MLWAILPATSSLWAAVSTLKDRAVLNVERIRCFAVLDEEEDDLDNRKYMHFDSGRKVINVPKKLPTLLIYLFFSNSVDLR